MNFPTQAGKSAESLRGVLGLTKGERDWGELCSGLLCQDVSWLCAGVGLPCLVGFAGVCDGCGSGGVLKLPSLSLGLTGRSVSAGEWLFLSTASQCPGMIQCTSR